MKLFLLLSFSWSLFLAYTKAELVFRSGPYSGPPSPCPGFQETNATYFNVSITPFNASTIPDNSRISVYFDSTGLNASTGYGIINFALFEDGEQALPAVGMVPAYNSPVTFTGSIFPPAQFSAKMGEDLLSANNVTAQLWVDVTLPEGQEVRTECYQTRLRRVDEGDDESDSSSSTDAGASNGNGNSTTNGESNPPSSTDAGASNNNGNLTNDRKGSQGASNEGFGNSTSNDNGSNSASDEGSGNSTKGNNGSNGKSDGGPGNSTSDDNGDGASAEESGANVPQVAFSLVM
jgi:hypothetical protein